MYVLLQAGLEHYVFKDASTKFCYKRLLFPWRATASKMNVYCYSKREKKRHLLKLKKICNILFFKYDATIKRLPGVLCLVAILKGLNDFLSIHPHKFIVEILYPHIYH